MLPKLSRVLNRVEKRLNNIGLMDFDFLYMFPTRIFPENIFNRHSLLTDFDEITRVFIWKLGPTDYIPYKTQHVSLLSDKSRQHFYFYLHSRRHERGLFEYCDYWTPHVFMTWILAHLENRVDCYERGLPYHVDIATSALGFMVKCFSMKNI
jgi:hypothetical protein